MPGKRPRIRDFAEELAALESDTDDEDEPDSYVNLWLKYCDDLNISPPIRYRDFEKYGQILVQKPYTTAARYVDAAWKYVRNNAIEVDERDFFVLRIRSTSKKRPPTISRIRSTRASSYFCTPDP